MLKMNGINVFFILILPLPQKNMFCTLDNFGWPLRYVYNMAVIIVKQGFTIIVLYHMKIRENLLSIYAHVCFIKLMDVFYNILNQHMYTVLYLKPRSPYLLCRSL